MSYPLELHPDRYFDPEPSVREIARRLYDETKDLPLVCPHGHVPPPLLAENALFPEPAALLIRPDHYLFRMLYSRGVPMEALGVPPEGPDANGVEVEEDPRAIWQTFAEHYHLFRGTPSRAWLDYELHEVFGVRERLTAESAPRVYAQIREQLQQPGFRPQALFERFQIEVLTTTDPASSDLRFHQQICTSDWDGGPLQGRVVPCFRPDAALAIASAGWAAEIEALEAVSGQSITCYSDFIRVLEERRAFFQEMGATSTDHAVVEPRTERLSGAEARRLFDQALRGEAVMEDERAFQAHMFMEMARMSCEDGLVMQIHAGALRDHHASLYQRFGPDKGADIPVRTEFTRNLRPLLNAYGAHPNFRLVLFTLDESTYARELAPLAGHYPAVRLGPAWWFHDSIEGMLRYRQRTTETAGIYNTAGFNDDTRAFCSIPARHDLARRVDATYLARLVAQHQIAEDEAHEMARALAADLARETYRLGEKEKTAARSL